MVGLSRGSPPASVSQELVLVQLRAYTQLGGVTVLSQSVIIAFAL